MLPAGLPAMIQRSISEHAMQNRGIQIFLSIATSFQIDTLIIQTAKLRLDGGMAMIYVWTNTESKSLYDNNFPKLDVDIAQTGVVPGGDLDYLC